MKYESFISVRIGFEVHAGNPVLAAEIAKRLLQGWQDDPSCCPATLEVSIGDEVPPEFTLYERLDDETDASYNFDYHTLEDLNA